MKRILAMLLTLSMLAGWIAMTPVNAHAEEATEPTNSAQTQSDWEEYLSFKLNEDGESYSVTDCDTSTEGELTIPATYNGLPVTAIGDYAFYYCDALTNVTVPDSVTTIGDSAFQYCSDITSVTIGNSVATIGDCAFCGCSSLTDITIPDSVTSIGDSAFNDCDGLTSVTIPDSVTTIGNYAFAYCSSLTSVTVGNGVATIGNYAFYSCTSLTGFSVAANNPNYSSDSYGVLFNKNKTELIQVPRAISGAYIIPDSVTTIGEDAFYACDGLTSVTIPNSVTTIGEYAFWGCDSLTSVTIGNSVATIGDCAFCGCSLTSVTIPDSVTTIGSSAFGATDLTSVTIGNGVTHIGEDAFSGCDRLDKVYITDIAAWCQIDFESVWSNPLWSAYSLILNNKWVRALEIPNGVTTISDYAFYDYAALTSVTIPDSVTTIGEDAFICCDGLTSVTIPDSVTTIGDTAFYWCYNLRSVTIGSSVATIGDYAFYNCPYLTGIFVDESNSNYSSDSSGVLFNKNKTELIQAPSVIKSYTIPDSVTTIGDNAFEKCSKLTSVTIPDSVTTIGDNAFYDCSSLTSITIPDSVVSIGNSAFRFCDSLTSVTIPNSVTTIGEYAFWGCDSLTSVTIPNSVTTIGMDAFYKCTSLTDVYITDVSAWCGISFADSSANPLSEGAKWYLNGALVTDLVIPDSVTTIGDYAFYNCQGLTSVIIPDSVVSIGNSAFEGCTGLTSVTIPNSITTIGRYAFTYCDSLTSVTIPDSVTTIGRYAFAYCDSLTSVAIPDSVNNLDSSTFGSCSSLTGVWVDENNPMYSSDSFGVVYNKNKTKLIFVPCAIVKCTVPVGVTHIPNNAFAFCSSLTSIAIPDSVTTIGKNAFKDCDSLTDVYYGGTRELWKEIEVLESNTYLLKAILHTSHCLASGIHNYENDFDTTCSTCSYVRQAECSLVLSGYRVVLTDDFATHKNIRLTIFCLGDQTVTDPTDENVLKAIDSDAETHWGVSKINKLRLVDAGNYVLLLKYNVDTAIKKVALAVSLEDYPCTDGHTEQLLPAKEATCTATGLTEGKKCSACGEILVAQNEISATGHTEEIISGYAATCTETGLTEGKKCSACGEILVAQNKILATGHTVEIIPGYAATCTEPGLTEGKKCSVCGKILVAQEVIPATGHTEEIIPGKAPTATETGLTEGLKCAKANCGMILREQEVLPVLPAEATVSVLTLKLNQDGCSYYVAACDKTAAIDVVIPATCNGAPVTAIGDNAFKDCLTITAVSIPDSIQTIGQYAFSNCDALSSVVLPEGITEIAPYTFSYCLILETVSIPESVTVIGMDAFTWSKNMLNVSIPSGTTYIGANAFRYCEKIPTFTIPAGVTFIGDKAFSAGAAFEGLFVDPDNAYYSSDEAGVLYDKNKTVLIRGSGAVTGTYVIPNTVVTVEGYAFANCDGITGLVIPDSITTIGNYAFSACSKLATIWFGRGVTTVGEGAFQSLNALTDAYYEGTQPQFETITFGIKNESLLNAVRYAYPSKFTVDSLTYTLNSDGLSYCVSACDTAAAGEIVIPAYIANWSVTKVGFPVVAIGKQAFNTCTGVTKITIPDSVTAIGSLAFRKTGLTEIVIPRNVTAIEDYAFSYCTSLTKVAFSANVTSVGKYAFNNCTALTDVYYTGTQTQWNAITVAKDNEPLLNAALHTDFACAYGHTEETLPSVNAACTEPGLTEGKKCSVCGEILVAQEEIPALGHTPDEAVKENETATGYDSVVYCETCGTELSREPVVTACTHSYDHDFDADCNACGEVRQLNNTYKFENYRVIFVDPDTTHKNFRVEIYELGDKTVVDPSDEKALKAIDSTPATHWGAGNINKILITDAGNYVLLLKYNVGTAVVKVPMVLSVSADPKLIIDKNNKLTAIDNNGANINHRVVVYYLGDQTVEDIYDEAALKAIDSAPETHWQKTRINKLALVKGGNYVLHLCYNVGTGAKQTVAQQFTVESIPTLSVNQNNMLIGTEENAENRNHRMTVFYLGDETVEDIYNETAVKNAAISSKTYWGLSEINKVEVQEGGNYIFHLYYNVGTSAKRTLAIEATLTERPQLSVSEDNKLVVTYSDASITNPRAYIYDVGDAEVADIYDETALKKIATPTQVWGIGSILKKQLTPGTYVIHLHYNVAGGAKSTVALQITI